MLLCLGECLELVCDIAELPEDCRGRWESFVDETLRETNRRNTVELVSTIQSPSLSTHTQMLFPLLNHASIPFYTFCHFLTLILCLSCVSQVSTHNLHSSSEDDDMESPFPNDLSLQQVGSHSTMTTHLSAHEERSLFHVPPAPQAFSDYQIQQMTANFVDQFGFNDEEFSEHDENIK